MNEGEHRKELEGRLNELRALVEATADDRRPVALDQVAVGRLSRIDAMQRQAMAEATKRKHLHEIKRIEAALKRMEEGEFGFCVSCGEEIAPARLKADPAVARCVGCAQ
ncbi:MAG: TraR/DksA C4-type zinc finger protein [Amphiplicatus sp.]